MQLKDIQQELAARASTDESMGLFIRCVGDSIGSKIKVDEDRCHRRDKKLKPCEACFFGCTLKDIRWKSFAHPTQRPAAWNWGSILKQVAKILCPPIHYTKPDGVGDDVEISHAYAVWQQFWDGTLPIHDICLAAEYIQFLDELERTHHACSQT